MANGRTSQQWSWMTDAGHPRVPGSLSAFDYEELARFFKTLPNFTLLTREGSVVTASVDPSIAPALKALCIVLYNIYINNREASGIRADMRSDFEDATSPLLAALALVVLHDRPVAYGGTKQPIGALDQIDIDFLRMLDAHLDLAKNVTIPHGMKKLVRDSWDLISLLDADIKPLQPGEDLIDIAERFQQLPRDIERILALVYFEKTLAPLGEDLVERGLVDNLPAETRTYFTQHALVHAGARLHSYQSYGPNGQQPVAAIRGLDLVR